MIHQVKPLPLAEPLLLEIVALQIAVLKAACQENVRPDLTAELFRPILEEYLSNKILFTGREQEIANWIVRKPKFIEYLAGFSEGSQEEKENFVENIIEDVVLLFTPKEATIRIAILDNSPEWQKRGGDFLYSFYDYWKSGFDQYLFSNPIKSAKYTKQDFLVEFEEIHPDLYMCAICDSTAYKTKTDTHIYTSIEHYLPRSIYPHFSCHPRNLIPICSFCNSYIKGTENPLILDGNQLLVSNLILPYQEIAFSQRAYIALLIRDQRNRELEHPLRIELKSARDPDLSTQLSAFNHLYKVDERWSGQFDQIEEQTYRRIIQFLNLSTLRNPITKPENLADQLRLLMAITDTQNLGKDPFAFPMIWIIKSYIDDVAETEEQSPVYKSVNKWAQEVHERWKELQTKAVEIEQRVPEEI